MRKKILKFLFRYTGKRETPCPSLYKCGTEGAVFMYALMS
jgi:hypothetical protein